MQFRLVYQGKLPAASYSGGGTRMKEKHEIRRVLHKQLVHLWNTHPFLGYHTRSAGPYINGVLDERLASPTTIANIGKRFDRCGFRFVPLIGSAFGRGTETACSVDILFLRRDEPGNLVHSGGDIDNRIKVLFDALRMPQNCEEVRGFVPAPDEEPFFCLLEDDKLIREVRVTTDRLLTPLQDDQHVHDVNLIIHVTTLTVGVVWSDIGFGPETDSG